MAGSAGVPPSLLGHSYKQNPFRHVVGIGTSILDQAAPKKSRRDAGAPAQSTDYKTFSILAGSGLANGNRWIKDERLLAAPNGTGLKPGPTSESHRRSLETKDFSDARSSQDIEEFFRTT